MNNLSRSCLSDLEIYPDLRLSDQVFKYFPCVGIPLSGIFMKYIKCLRSTFTKHRMKRKRESREGKLMSPQNYRLIQLFYVDVKNDLLPL